MRIKVTSKALGKGGFEELSASLQRFIADKTPVPDAAWRRVSDILSEGAGDHYVSQVAPSINNTPKTRKRKIREANAKKVLQRGAKKSETAVARFTDPGIQTGFLLEKIVERSRLPEGSRWKIERVTTNPASYVERGHFEWGLATGSFYNAYPSYHFDPTLKLGAGASGLSISSKETKLVRDIIYNNAFRSRLARAFKRGGGFKKGA